MNLTAALTLWIEGELVKYEILVLDPRAFRPQYCINRNNTPKNQVFKICNSKTYQASKDEVAAFIIEKDLLKQFDEAVQIFEDDPP